MNSQKAQPKDRVQKYLLSSPHPEIDNHRQRKHIQQDICADVQSGIGKPDL